MPTATMTSKGQVTIPAQTRANLRLGSGSTFTVRETADGEIVLKPKRVDIRSLRGFLKYDGPPVSIEDINEGIARAAAEGVARSFG
jgi:antitoxin PrlF